MTTHALRALDETPDEPQTAAVPATYQIQLRGTWRDALLVPDVAERLFGTNDRAACQRVLALIRTQQLFARSTGKTYLIPVGAYAAYLRGEPYP